MGTPTHRVRHQFFRKFYIFVNFLNFSVDSFTFYRIVYNGVDVLLNHLKLGDLRNVRDKRKQLQYCVTLNYINRRFYTIAKKYMFNEIYLVIDFYRYRISVVRVHKTDRYRYKNKNPYCDIRRSIFWNRQRNQIDLYCSFMKHHKLLQSGIIKLTI